MESLDLKRTLIKNAGFQSAAHAVSLVIGILTAMVLSRYLGVEGFGQFNYVFAFFYFFFSINDFGVSLIVVRSISKQRERAGEIIGAMLSFRVLLSVICVLAAWAVIGVMDFPKDLRDSLRWYAVILLVMTLQLPAVIFQVLLKLEYSSLMGIFNRVLGFLLLMAVVWMGYGLVALAAILVLSEVVYSMVLLRYTRRFVRPVWRFDPRLWKEVLRSSIPLGIMGLFVALVNRVDFIMLEKMTDLRQVGLYSAAYKVTNVLEVFPLMMMGTIYPLMSHYAKENLSKLRVLYRKSTLYLGAVAVPMAVGVTLFAPFIIRVLFGAEFAGAERSLVVLVWATVCLYLTTSGGNLLISMGHEKTNLGLNVFGGVLNIALNLVLIPGLGLFGAALTKAVTYLVMMIGISLGVYKFLYAPVRAESLLGVQDARI